MSKDQAVAIKDAVHKLQLSLLEGVNDHKQLFAAGSLISRSDYEDVVTERTIANFCGYPLCRNSLPSGPSSKGRYRISLKEHKVYDLQETSKFCSSGCLINSRTFSGTLQEERCSVLNPVKLNEILRLFQDLSVEDSSGVNGDWGLSSLKIHEKEEPKKGGEVSLEEWMGPSNAIEGYVPKNDKNLKGSSSTRDKPGSKKDFQFNEMDFMSTIITSDEYSVSKLPPHSTEATFDGKSEELEVQRGSKDLVQQAAHSSSSLTLDKPSSKKGLFDEMDFMSTIITSDEYSVSKLPPHSTEVTFHDQSKAPRGKGASKDLEHRAASSGSSSAPRQKGSNKKSKEAKGKFKIVEKDKSTIQEVLQTHDQDGTNSATSESGSQLCAGNACASSDTTLKPSLKSSRSKKLSRSVTWADENTANGGSGDLCEVRVIDDTKTGPKTFPDIDKDGGDNALRFVSAEACATALSQAAEIVACGGSDVSDAVSEAGIILLSSLHQVDEEETKEGFDEEPLELEPTLLKWPKKLGTPDSDLFDPEQSWFDEPPDGFSLTLSTFAIMWNALFGWVTSSSLAYIYGKDESSHEEYLSVNGREYPRKIVLGDGRSSEIKETLAGCLARALPGLTTDLRLPIPISELEKGLACLLDTMSFTESLPAFRMRQWQVVVLLLIDALSVSRVPAVTTYMANGRMLVYKVLDGGSIGMEEYDIMKDHLLPLGRAPQFSSQSGA